MFTQARDIAVKALRDRAGNVSAHVRRLVERGELEPADRALASELALGVVRRRGTLDAILRAFLKRPTRRLPTPLTEILHVGLYQVVFLDRVPDFAAVDEAVNQAQRWRHKRQSGLVNGLLRSVIRRLSPVTEGDIPAEANVIPIGARTYRRMENPVLPDPERYPTTYLAAAYSLPAVLAERWVERFGSAEQAAATAAQANVRAPLIARVNRLRATVEQAAEAMTAQDAKIEPHVNGLSLVIRHPRNITPLKAFTDGLIQPQDPTATAVALAAGVEPGMNVLDYCAAPGTKTTHLAELMANRGSITAVDVTQGKLEQIESNCRRLGITIVATQPAGQVGSFQPQSFDAVLVDAPCSNSGVLARRPEARWRFSEEAMSGLVADQKSLLQAAAIFVRPGGRLVYSTCSIEPEECGEVVRWLCGQHPRLKVASETLTLPGGGGDLGRWCDGGYMAVFGA